MAWGLHPFNPDRRGNTPDTYPMKAPKTKPNKNSNDSKTIE